LTQNSHRNKRSRLLQVSHSRKPKSPDGYLGALSSLAFGTTGFLDQPAKHSITNDRSSMANSQFPGTRHTSWVVRIEKWSWQIGHWKSDKGEMRPREFAAEIAAEIAA